MKQTQITHKIRHCIRKLGKTFKFHEK